MAGRQPATPETKEAAPLSVQEKRLRAAHETLGLDPNGKPKPPTKLPPPVYDERGNVRPRGTKGAKPMSYDERVKIAQRLAKGEKIVTTAEKSAAPD
jgi:hypothetical protein